MAITKTSSSSPSASRDWLDSGGRFKFGKYRGSLAEDIARDDPQYIQWIVDKVEDISEDDREILSQLLAYRSKSTPRRRS